MTIVDPDDRNREVADAAGIRFIQQAVTTANMRQLVGTMLAGPGQGFLVNVSVEVCSMELIKMCRDLGCLYIDTWFVNFKWWHASIAFYFIPFLLVFDNKHRAQKSIVFLFFYSFIFLPFSIEPEPGGYTDRSKSMASRTNYAMREAALGLRRPGMNDPTAIVGHGANPGMVSHLVKRALQQLALDQTGQKVAPQSPQEWAMLARDLGVQGIHIAGLWARFHIHDM
jgi:homospermidine synthase